MSLTDDPTFHALRAEAMAWHLTQTAHVTRHGTEIQGGRDVDVEIAVFSGLVGVKRRDAQGGFVTVEFPHDAAISPGDVVSLAQRPDLPLIVESYTPATDNAPLGKARCVFRVEPPRAK